MNLLPFTVYERRRLGELRPGKIVLQFADRSNRLPRGVVERMLLKVGEFKIPIDFVVLNIERVSNVGSHIPVILG